jgi:hypothetical protein
MYYAGDWIVLILHQRKWGWVISENVKAEKYTPKPVI